MYPVSVLTAFAALGLAGQSLAAALSITTYDANYDDISVGLYYQGFAVNQFTTAIGLVPHSKPNGIVSGVEQTATSGRAGFSTSGTSTKSFNLKSLYYGCVVNTAEGTAGAAQTCTFDVQGFRNLNDPTANYVAIQRLTYDHITTSVSDNMVQANLNLAFTNLQRIDIVQVDATLGTPLNVIALDDLVYTIF